MVTSQICQPVSEYTCTYKQHQVTFDQDCLDLSFGGSAEQFIITSSDIAFPDAVPSSDPQCEANGNNLRFDLNACNVKDLSDDNQFYYEFRLVFQDPSGIIGGDPEFSKKYSCKISKLIETSATINGAAVVVGPASDDIETQQVEVDGLTIVIVKEEKQFQTVDGLVVETLNTVSAGEDVEVTVSATASVNIAIESEFYLTTIMNNSTALAETETAYCNAAEFELNAQDTQVDQCNLEITETVEINPNQSLQEQFPELNSAIISSYLANRKRRDVGDGISAKLNLEVSANTVSINQAEPIKQAIDTKALELSDTSVDAIWKSIINPDTSKTATEYPTYEHSSKDDFINQAAPDVSVKGSTTSVLTRQPDSTPNSSSDETTSLEGVTYDNPTPTSTSQTYTISWLLQLVTILLKIQ